MYFIKLLTQNSILQRLRSSSLNVAMASWFEKSAR